MTKENDIGKYLKFYSGKFGQEVLEKELEFVEVKLKGCKSVLSIGCGPAFLETRLHRLHPEINITCLDNWKKMIVHASKSIHLEYGVAHHLGFDDSSFDAVLYVTSLEFIANYKKAIREAHRVLKPKGKVLIMMLNPKSRYFRDEYADVNSYIRKNIKHTDTKEIKAFTTQYFFIEAEEYFLGIKDGKIFDSSNPKLASLFVLEGIKHGK